MMLPVQPHRTEPTAVQPWRVTDGAWHTHCWHDRTLTTEYTEGTIEYEQCCRCDEQPALEGDT